MRDNSGGREVGRTSRRAVIAHPFGTLRRERISDMVGLVHKRDGAMQAGRFSGEGKKLNEGGVSSITKIVGWLACMRPVLARQSSRACADSFRIGAPPHAWDRGWAAIRHGRPQATVVGPHDSNAIVINFSLVKSCI